MAKKHDGNAFANLKKASNDRKKQINDYENEVVQDQEEETKTSGYVKKGYNEKSKENLQTRQSGTATPKAYMQLNIYEYEDYIYRMSKVQNAYTEKVKPDGRVVRTRKNVSMTDYVLGLIEADMKKNEALYEALKERRDLDKPARITKNKKKD